MFIPLILLLLFALTGAASAEEPGEISSSQAEISEAAEPTVTISLENGKTVSGRLIADYRKEDGTGLTALQRRDGAIEVIHSEEITEMRRTETPFRPMTQEEADAVVRAVLTFGE